MEEIWNLLRQGGPLMVPIGLCSIISMAVIIQKALELRHSRIFPGPVGRWVDKAGLQEGVPDSRPFRSPAGELIRHIFTNRERPFAENHISTQSFGQQINLDLQRGLRTLEIITTVAPLLGLAGTIQGLIVLFESIESSAAMGNSELAKGIGIALMTTFAGLLVSIPSVIGWHIFHRKVEVISASLEAMSDKLLARIYGSTRPKPRD